MMRGPANVMARGPANVMARVLKLSDYSASQEGPAKKSKRVVRVDGIKIEEARVGRSETLAALENELARLVEAGEQ